TMDEQRARAVREAFFRLFKDNLIYRGKRLVNWDPVTQTSLADDEVEMQEVDGFFYYLRYPLCDRAGNPVTLRDPTGAAVGADNLSHITVATTRPETMLGDTAVAVNPKDPRARLLRGLFVRLPIVNRIVPIVEDSYVVLPVSLGGDPNDPKAQFATGFLKVTPAHDANDYELGLRHNLPIINVMAPDASISLDHGWLEAEPHIRETADPCLRSHLLGKGRDEARTAVVHFFRDNQLLQETRPYRHSVGHSYRSHVPIEPYLSDQWYLRVTDKRLAARANSVLAEDQRTLDTPVSSGTEGALQRRSQGTVRFHPARYAKTYETWHHNIRDWCISRQLWWGHRIPVWYVEFIQTFSGQGKTGSELDDRWKAHLKECEHRLRGYLEKQGISPDDLVIQEAGPLIKPGMGHLLVSRDPRADRILEKLAAERESEVCPADSDVAKLGLKSLRQDPDVLDTWFSSALWPLSTLGWPDPDIIKDQRSPLNRWNPSNVLCTAREIITLWVSRMVMFNLYFRDCVPFRDVCIVPVIQDGEGRRMSKSFGNGVDPLDIIQTHGADALRYTLASMATSTQDVRMPVEVDANTGKNTSPKFDLGRAFCVKLWNAARFVLMQLERSAPEQHTPATQSAGSGAAPVAQPAGDGGVCESLWTMADRWIVSRFNRTVGEATAALEAYRFDQYARTIYDFFWRDFCDWYLEAAKPQLRSEPQRTQTTRILAAVFDGALRLMHPLLPHVTEVLWWKLNEICPERGLPGRILTCTSPRLIRAAFPQDSRNYSEAAEHIFPRIQEIITAIRNLRNDHKVDSKKPVDVAILAPGDAARQIEAMRPAIEQMAVCRLTSVGAEVMPASGSVRASVGKCEIYVEGLIDTAAEEQRLARLRQELQRKIATLRGRLENEGYLARAPARLVQETRDQLAAAEAELARLSSS
ncbi:MAG: valine--tRNA ligase, partial [Phycisphaerae bacterium]|nr:valine--tRNA ligase [Phycisphaerae bacterium]